MRKGASRVELCEKREEQAKQDRADALPEDNSSISMLAELLAEMRLS